MRNDSIILKVKKNDSTIEKFNIGKIELAVKKSGCNPEDTKKIKENMVGWAKEKSKHIHMVASDEIGKKVFFCLKELNPEAASNFNEFKGFFGGKTRYRYHAPEQEKLSFFKRLFRGAT